MVVFFSEMEYTLCHDCRNKYSNNSERTKRLQAIAPEIILDEDGV